MSSYEKSINVCLMSNILHGLAASGQVESALREMLRVLKPDGILAVVDFKKMNGPPGPPLSIRMSPAEVEEIIGRYGFRREKTIEPGKYHYALVFRPSRNKV